MAEIAAATAPVLTTQGPFRRVSYRLYIREDALAD
jgi:hypothetical protein